MPSAVESEILRRMHWTVHSHFDRCATCDWTDSDNEESNEPGEESLAQDQGPSSDSTSLAHMRSSLGCKGAGISKKSTRSFKASRKFYEIRKKASNTSSADAQITVRSPVCSRPNSVSLTAETLGDHDKLLSREM
mmetsp:Transcript_16129/g.34247  ORF Transcript_16129/g.34247 Transcript_16129/m.34247 type:complete len:135 (-) Transcript_16129:69-473(-)